MVSKKGINFLTCCDFDLKSSNKKSQLGAQLWSWINVNYDKFLSLRDPYILCNSEIVTPKIVTCTSRTATAWLGLYSFRSSYSRRSRAASEPYETVHEL